MPGPIRPEEVKSRKAPRIPEEVFDVFNELIVKNWNGHAARVLQTDAGSMIAGRLNISFNQVCDQHFLDVEDSYREAGWIVDYDKPGYNETYEAIFTFRLK